MLCVPINYVAAAYKYSVYVYIFVMTDEWIFAMTDEWSIAFVKDS